MIKKKTRNKFEERVHGVLKRAKVSVTYESEKIPYVLARHYTPDFIFITKTGKIYLETKGYLRPEDKSKMVAVKKCNPQLDIRILFYAPDKITLSVRKRLDQYIRWAVKNGFRWAVDNIPEDWLDGR